MAVVKVVPKQSKKRCGCSTEFNPNTTDWNDPIGGSCLDINSELTPLLPQSVPATVIGTASFDSGIQLLTQC